MPTGVIRRSCAGPCPVQHDPSRPLALYLELAPELADAMLAWSSPSSGLPSFSGSYASNQYTIQPADVRKGA